MSESPKKIGGGSRGRRHGANDTSSRPLELCQDDERKFFQLLDWFAGDHELGIPSQPQRENKRDRRLRRVELILAGVVIGTTGQVASLLIHGPNAPQVVSQVIERFV